MSRTPLLYLAPVAWNTIKQRPQRIAELLSNDFDLTWVEPVGLRSARLGDVSRLFPRKIAAVQPSTIPTLSTRYIPWHEKSIRAVNRRWLLRQMESQWPSPRQDWILWVSTPSELALALSETRRPSLVVYDCMDNYAAFHRGCARRRIEADEKRLLRQVDLVFASSTGLAERISKLHPRVQLVPNGVDHDHFANAQANAGPADLAAIDGPIIGYQGTIGEWLDFELIDQLAVARPDWNWVFVGPVHSRKALALGRRENVHFLGPRQYADLPAYTAHFDVGVIPFVCNELTRDVHPIKALEYLAAGLPVVSVPLCDLRNVAKHVYFASSPQEWLKKLEHSLGRSQQPREERQRAARAHDWRSRYASIHREILVASQGAAASHGAERLPSPHFHPTAVERDLDIGVIYTHERKFIEPLLSSIAESGPGVSKRLILVDNASAEGVTEWNHAVPDTVVVKNSARLHYAANLNRILAAATARYVLLLNTDMLFPPDEECLTRMTRFMDDHPDCGLATCRILHADGEYAWPARRFQTLKIIAARRLPKVNRGQKTIDDYLYRDRNHRSDFECDWVSGCFLFIRREAALAVGMFDEGFKKYFEDVDYCARMRQAGWRVMLHGGASCIHYEQRASKRLFSRDAFTHLRSYVRWLGKWGTGAPAFDTHRGPSKRQRSPVLASR